MFKILPTPLAGCLILRPRIQTDTRGRFVKVYHDDFFHEQGLDFVPLEQYYSITCKNALRGMHFQMPPYDHSKVVFCTAGEVLDIVLDLRLGSPTHGQHARIPLSAETGELLYIPTGMAHGFCTPVGEATMMYLVSSVHAPTHDSGIHWGSFGADWPLSDPVISDRDRALPPFSTFKSPFEYHAAKNEWHR